VGKLYGYAAQNLCVQVAEAVSFLRGSFTGQYEKDSRVNVFSSSQGLMPVGFGTTGLA
jgi:hypothetical protein